MVTLLQLKQYLQTHGQTNLLKLAKEFSEDPKQIMLIAEHFIAKGKICCEQNNAKCGSCHGCFTGNLINLRWMD